jgi:hypothetical protein
MDSGKKNFYHEYMDTSFDDDVDDEENLMISTLLCLDLKSITHFPTIEFQHRVGGGR